jgi:hypothetical protein
MQYHIVAVTASKYWNEPCNHIPYFRAVLVTSWGSLPLATRHVFIEPGLFSLYVRTDTRSHLTPKVAIDGHAHSDVLLRFQLCKELPLVHKQVE